MSAPDNELDEIVVEIIEEGSMKMSALTPMLQACRVGGVGKHMLRRRSRRCCRCSLVDHAQARSPRDPPLPHASRYK